jgi:hypothetical protein
MDSLYPGPAPGGAVRFHANGKFHDVWHWNYWVVGPRTMHIQFWDPKYDPQKAVVATFDDDLTKFHASFGGHEVTGTRLEPITPHRANSPTDPDRGAAEWVLSIGGTIKINENGSERDIKSGGELPRGAFELTVADLDRNAKVTDAGLAYFEDCKNLTGLGLRGAKVSDAGLAYLSDCKDLTELGLEKTEVTDAGLERLAGFRKLASLFVKRTKVTEAGVKKLAAALPRCRIEWDGAVVEPKADAATTNAPTADGIPALDPFQPKSIWVGNKKPKLVLTVTERNGASFRARFVVGPGITRMINGTVKDGKVDWFAKDVIAIKGHVGDDNHGTIASDDLGDKIDFVWGQGSEIKGQFTLRLQK